MLLSQEVEVRYLEFLRRKNEVQPGLFSYVSAAANRTVPIGKTGTTAECSATTTTCKALPNPRNFIPINA